MKEKTWSLGTYTWNILLPNKEICILASEINKKTNVILKPEMR